MGFLEIATNGPNYWYTQKYQTYESRMKYQKHKLKNSLPNYNDKLTEWENMANNKFDRIWDCGNKVFAIIF